MTSHEDRATQLEQQRRRREQAQAEQERQRREQIERDRRDRQAAQQREEEERRRVQQEQREESVLREEADPSKGILSTAALASVSPTIAVVGGLKGQNPSTNGPEVK